MPRLYVGDGFAGNGAEPNDKLFAYRPLPGTFYCVTRCTDLKGTETDQLTTTLHLTLVVAPLGVDDKEVKISELRRRLRLPQNTGDDAIIDEMVKRGLAFRFHAALLRRASWLPKI